MRKRKRITRASAVLLVVASLLTTSFAFGAFHPQEAQALLEPDPVVYNIYATDGYHTMADGRQIYAYGFVGGRQGQPLTYLDKMGNPVTIAGGAPAPTGGPITAAEKQLAGNAQVPGPLMYATTDDVVEIRLKNLGVTVKSAPNDPHTIHLHGVDVDAANDGVPETSVAAVPANSGLPGAGNVVVYMFAADHPGTYMYHCHQEADIHVTMGMYGALVIYNPGEYAAANGGPNNVDPEGGPAGELHGFSYDKDYVMLLTETDIRQHFAELRTGQAGGFNPVDYTPQYWFINGLSFPNTVHANLPGTAFLFETWYQAYVGYDPLIAGSVNDLYGRGEKVLVRLINLGFETQPMHIHGFHPKVIGGDQRAWPWANDPGWPTGQGLEKNTFTVGSGETYELLLDFSVQQVASTYDPGTQSRYNAGTGLPAPNTADKVLNPAIPDPFNPGFTYIGGPTVTGVVGHPDPDSQYFPWHNHDDYKSTNNGVYPGGQFTLVRIDP